MTQDTILAEDISAQSYALCPLDGRYHQISEKLSDYFSENALVENRVGAESLWLYFFIKCIKCDIVKKNKTNEYSDAIYDEIYDKFSNETFKKVKSIEQVTNHDVKAVELYIDEKLKELGMNDIVSLVHIGCTSEDINNVSYANMIKGALNNVWIPSAEKLIEVLRTMALENAGVSMLAHTHGQKATPTTVGKELAIYVKRLNDVIEQIDDLDICAKWNGATGNYAALSTVFPDVDWQEASKIFVEDYLGLTFNPMTTQIESHDWIVNILDAMRHFNNILLDLDVDMWLYISMDYFKQIPVKNEVGSSTMPHKVNPIRFENSEANVGMSNAILMELSNKLPKSRMQRDLSDSSAMRNIGLGFGYSLQAIEQTTGGLEKVVVNKEKLAMELNNSWEVLAEPIQTMLRKYGVPDAYDRLKDETRGKDISKKDIRGFINSLDMLSKKDKNILLKLTPAKYIGYAVELTLENI
jgi:adenylosuccinate lyase